MRITVREAQSADLDWVLDVNNRSAPNVNELDRESMASLAAMAAYFRIACCDDRRAGFLLALAPDAAYDSVNFLWFAEHYPAFLYIDRVVIAPDSRRLGVGRVLYADVTSYAELHAPLLTCEVNIHPPNPGSVLFHSGQGFVEVGQHDVPAAGKRVSLLAREIPSFSFVQGQTRGI